MFSGGCNGLMATHLFLFIRRILYAHILYVLHKKQKNRLCQQKNLLRRSYVAHENYVCHKKYVVATKKICYTQKRCSKERDSEKLNMFRVAQKRNICWHKIVPVAYKYMLYWFVSHKKYFDFVQILKLVCLNVINFCQNGMP